MSNITTVKFGENCEVEVNKVGNNYKVKFTKFDKSETYVMTANQYDHFLTCLTAINIKQSEVAEVEFRENRIG